MSKQAEFQSDNQNFWQLAVIQCASLGIPVFSIGGKLSISIGPEKALGSILLGNLILWLIGIGIISMTDSVNNAIENIAVYIGKTGKYVATLLLVVAFIGWFALQIRSSSVVIEHTLGGGIHKTIRLGSICGILIAMTSMGGIKTIRWINMCAFFALFVQGNCMKK